MPTMDICYSIKESIKKPCCTVLYRIVFIFSNDTLLAMAGLSFILLVPAGSMFNGSNKTNNRILMAYTIWVALIGLLGIWQSMQTGILFNSFTVIFLVAVFIYQWVANALIIKATN